LGLCWDHVTPEVTPEVALSRHQVEILLNCLEEQTISDLMKLAERAGRTKCRNQVLRPLLDAGFIEMTIPDKPTSSIHEYLLTVQERQLVRR
jgi:ATP-dependent DNA helicase RecG